MNCKSTYHGDSDFISGHSSRAKGSIFAGMMCLWIVFLHIDSHCIAVTWASPKGSGQTGWTKIVGQVYEWLRVRCLGLACHM